MFKAIAAVEERYRQADREDSCMYAATCARLAQDEEEELLRQEEKQANREAFYLLAWQIARDDHDEIDFPAYGLTLRAKARRWFRRLFRKLGRLVR